MDVVKTNLGDIDLDRLRDSACFAIGVGPWERDSLSPMGELRLAGCLAYADWVAHDCELSMKFAGVCKISGWKLVNSWLVNRYSGHRCPTTYFTNVI